MSSPITLLGIGPNSLPGVYGQINFAQGQLSLGGSTYSAIILANITSSGSAFSGISNNQVYGPDTQVTMQSVNDAITLFGAGSPAHLMVADFMAVNKSTPLYVLPVAQASGGAAATFTLTLTSSGTLTNGAVSLQVGPDAPVVTAVNDAVVYYEKAVSLRPDYPDYRLSLASALLASGRLAEGWHEYENRFRVGGAFHRRMPLPQWDGQPVRGVILYAEQGHGDAIQFLRYAKVVKRQHPQMVVLVEVKKPLLDLVRTMDGFDGVVLYGQGQRGIGRGRDTDELGYRADVVRVHQPEIA